MPYSDFRLYNLWYVLKCIWSIAHIVNPIEKVDPAVHFWASVENTISVGERNLSCWRRNFLLPFTGPARLIVAKITFLCQFYGSSFSNIQILGDTCNNPKITAVQRIKSLSRSQNLVPESQHTYWGGQFITITLKFGCKILLLSLVFESTHRR